MARLVRKNLMVDPEALRHLAQQKGTSESEAVREAVKFATAAQEMVAALEGLHEVGAFADAEELFGPLADETLAAPARDHEESAARRARRA